MKPSLDEIWGCADYGPTALRLAPVADVVAARLVHEVSGREQQVVDIGAGHGHLTERLVRMGHRVTAVEPVRSMRRVGRRRCPRARWVEATGESTGLSTSGTDAVVSTFGSFLCQVPEGPREWARILRPGGRLVMTAWDRRGFLAEMTRCMVAATSGVDPGAVSMPGHMLWGDDGVAEERLGAGFAEVRVEPMDLDWCFADVEEGMRLYLEGSPTHTFSLRSAGERRTALEEALRLHLQKNTGPDGRIEASAGYVLVTAVSR